MKTANVIEGLRILAAYVPGGLEAHDLCADYGQVWAGPNDGSRVSDEDMDKLVDLGWSFDYDGGRWTAFAEGKEG